MSLTENMRQCLNEEIFTPHHGFIHTQVLVDMINAALQDAFPVLVLGGQVLLAQVRMMRTPVVQ